MNDIVKFAVDPLKMFEAGGETQKIVPANVAVAVGADRLVLVAVPGKRIRFMGAILQSQGAGLSGIAFKDGAGGAVLATYVAPSNASPSTAPNALPIPLEKSGYWETTAGNGLYADITTTAAYINASTIQYVP